MGAILLDEHASQSKVYQDEPLGVLMANKDVLQFQVVVGKAQFVDRPEVLDQLRDHEQNGLLAPRAFGTLVKQFLQVVAFSSQEQLSPKIALQVTDEERQAFVLATKGVELPSKELAIRHQVNRNPTDVPAQPFVTLELLFVGQVDAKALLGVAVGILTLLLNESTSHELGLVALVLVITVHLQDVLFQGLAVLLLDEVD